MNSWSLVTLPFIGLLALPWPRLQTSPESTLQCPSAIVVNEQAEAPMGWIADAARKEHRFARISIFNGPMGEQRKPSPVELAPDTESQRRGRVVQTWQLESYRDRGIVLVCRYADTEAAIARDVPLRLKSCEQSFDLGPNGRVVRSPKTPPAMICK